MLISCQSVEALGQIEIATKLLGDDSSFLNGEDHSSDQQLRCDFTPLEADSEEYSMFASTGNRMLLWHGSRLTNWAGILSQGLRFHMFGKGVYFADMFSKSANCCYASKASRSGVLLLCEVALGDMNEARSRYNDYIVYNTDQIKMRYALHVTLNFKS
ncbi:hypothetical protein HU200_029281 [Digitaria exilis]|uniref:Poly [ADP-ribose] polymerase n=1 Tax=Digitaria exilis TaxID=1010633 RepID=A0A835BZ01_9POAL|nr:hypothetical protein HU200_029281 [Digitaria exilis]